MNQGSPQKPRLRGGKVRPVRQNYTGLLAAVLILLIAAALLIGCAVAQYRQANPPDTDRENSGTTADGKTSENDTEGTSGDQTSDKTPAEGKIDYLNLTAEDLAKGDLVLVNRDYAFDAATVKDVTTVRDGRLTDIQENAFQLPIGETLLTALESLQTGMKLTMNDNVRLLVNAAYRTANDQTELVDYYTDRYGEDYVTKYVAQTGKSEHHTGLAADISFYDVEKKAVYATTSTDAAAHYSWVLNNCASYGLILRYSSEKEAVTGYSAETWHFRYVGIPHATYISENHLALEEYLTLLQNYSFENRLTVSCSDASYEIYYVAAEESGNTVVPVPKGANYTLSGDNHGGFIVTVKTSASPEA